MKNLKIFILKSLFLSLALLKKARQDINHSISLFLMIIGLKVIFGKLLGSTNLARAQAFCIHKSLEIIIVNQNKDLIFAIFQRVTPSLESFKNSQELLIMSLISNFCRNHLFRENGYWMPLLNFTGLRKIWILIDYITKKTLIQS